MANSSVKSKCGSFVNRETLPHTPTPTTTTNTALYSPSLSFKSVCLRDWWIIKPPEGQQGLAVAGFPSREGKTVRPYKSAAISKRHDATTLETVDGFTIALVGFIDKDLTEQNGFSDEICCNFYFGFPYNWEECIIKGSTAVLHAHASDFVQHTIKNRLSSRRNDSQSGSLDDLPATSRSDPLMNSHQKSDSCIRTMKAMDDLFECLSQLEHDESPSFQENNNAESSEAEKMASNTTQPTNSSTCIFQGGSVISKHTVGHKKQTKKKSSDKKIAKGSLPSESISSDSATAKVTVSAESPTILVDNMSRTIGKMHTVSRKMTRSMTKRKLR